MSTDDDLRGRADPAAWHDLAVEVCASGINGDVDASLLALDRPQVRALAQQGAAVCLCDALPDSRPHLKLLHELRVEQPRSVAARRADQHRENTARVLAALAPEDRDAAEALAMTYSGMFRGAETWDGLGQWERAAATLEAWDWLRAVRALGGTLPT